MKQRTSRKTWIAAALVLLLSIPLWPAAYLYGLAAYVRWVSPLLPRSDQSAAVEQAIREQYGTDVIALRVRQANDLSPGAESILPVGQVWGYRTEYRLKGLSLTFHPTVYEDEIPGDLADEGDPNHGVFPAELGLTDTQFLAVLRAYQQGSGLSTFERAGDFRDFELPKTVRFGKRSYPSDSLFTVQDGGPDDALPHIVFLDRGSGAAHYLGKWDVFDAAQRPSSAS